MAATLDDLLFAATATRSDMRSSLDRIERLLGGSGGGSGGGGAPAPAGGGAAPAGLLSGPAVVLGLFGALENAIGSFAGSIAKFVAKASPVHVMRFVLAIDDLQAVLGKTLLPIMERVTAGIRKVADAFVNLSPEAQKLAVGLGVGAGLGAIIGTITTAFAALFRIFGSGPAILGTLLGAFVGVATTMDSGRAILKAFDGVLKAVVVLFESLARVVMPVLEAGLVPLLNEFADAIKDVAEAIQTAINAIRRLAGLDALGEGKKSSEGAAVRHAEVGDIQSYINKAYKSAYMMGPGESVEEKQLEELKGIRAILARGGLVPREDSWASATPGAERIGGWIGGDEGGKIGRGMGRFADTVTGPFTAGPRTVVEGLRQLFGG